MTYATLRRTLSLFVLALLVLGLAPPEEAQAQPANDDLADATEITSLPFSGIGSNVGATTETDEDGLRNSVWWKFTASQEGRINVDTYGADYNTTLGVWTGGSHPLNREGYNNDAGGGKQSELTVLVEAGVTYYIRVAGGLYSPSEGNIDLNVSLLAPLPNDDLVDASVVGSFPYSATASNLGATVEPNEAAPDYDCAYGNDAGSSVWWKVAPSQAGIINVSTSGSDFDTFVGVWTGSGHPLTEEIVCNNYGDGQQAEAAFAATAGETYYVRVSSFDHNGQGNIDLSITRAAPLTNDDLSVAAVISSLPASINSSNYGATLESGELIPSCDSEADRSVWWSYTAPQEGVLTVDVSNSALHAAVVSVWTGNGHPLSEAACSGGNTQTTSQQVVAGETYYIRVSDGWGDSPRYEQGEITLDISFTPPIPNDDLADAIAIASFPFSDMGSNAGATGETDELSSDCSSSSGALNGVWWEYTASQDGVLTVDTDGSDFDRVLGLWTGAGHPLNEERCTDDSPEKVSYGVAAGETYYIRVSGYSDGGEGDISLSASLAPPLPNDHLTEAFEIASTPYSTTATLVGATLEADETITDCGDESGGEGSVWWTYTASQQGTLTIDTDGSTFDLVLSVWTGAGHPLDDRGCTDSDNGGVLDVSAGETYYIRISNYYPDEVGDISLAATFALPDPVYVDDDATGANDGSSWTNAYTNLHDALADGGPELWVAQGTYSNGSTSFELPDGVDLYGGFDGTETTRSERDWSQHKTVLTGGANHVLYARSVGGSTVLDGVTVSGGDADGSSDPSGGRADGGGGLYCDGRAIYGNFSGGCSPTLRNVIFEDNTADGDGGALYLDGSGGGLSSANPALYGVTFRNNTAAGRGGAMYNNGEEGNSSPVLSNVVFAENSAGQGGALFNWGALSGNATPTFTNVVFVDNTATGSGGAIDNSQAGGLGGVAALTLTNVTFTGNSAGQGGAIFNYKAPFSNGRAEVVLYNAIVWGNTDDSGQRDNLRNNGEATAAITDAILGGASNVCFLDSYTCTRLRDEDPDFAFASDPDGADNTYRTADDGLRPGFFSPAIDAGNYLSNTSPGDVAGNPRVFGGTIDLGAYERAVYQSESDAPGVGAQGGFFRLGSTGATALFSANASSGGGLSASRTDSAPSGSGLPAELVSSYWTINETLDGSFTYNVTFDLADAGGINDFDSLKVYKRSGSGDAWTEVDSLIHDAARQKITAAALTSFSQFAVGGTSAALPVELAAFEATPDGEGAVALTWQTASETNNDRFRVERQRKGGADWTKVGARQSRAPGGTSTEVLRYRFTDEALPFEAQALSYRLIQRDLDGTETTAGEKTVEIGAPQSFTLHGSFPNPMRAQTTIRYELPEERRVTVAVYDVLGRKVRTLVDGAAQAGRQEVAFEAGGLSSGMYFYRITAGDYTQARKLVLVR
jgi:predicted outer membrane repeat protein